MKRTGALRYVFTVEYATSDASAAAGKDYAETTGTLYFAGGVDTAYIEVPLINDGVIQSEADKSFMVTASDPKGGGPGSAVTVPTAMVYLFNSGSGETLNLATMLYSPDADDVSGGIAETPPIIKKVEAPKVTAVEPSEFLLKAEFTPAGEQSGDFSLMTYDGFGTLSFSRNKYPSYGSKYWLDWAYMAYTSNYNGWDINDVSGYMSNSSGKWTNVGRYDNSGTNWRRTSERTSSGYLSVDNLGERYNHLNARMDYICDLIGDGYQFFGEWGYSDPGIRLKNYAGSVLRESCV